MTRRVLFKLPSHWLRWHRRRSNGSPRAQRVHAALPATSRLLALNWRVVLHLFAIVFVIASLVRVAALSGGLDAHAYWAASLDHPYLRGIANTDDAYLYSPAFLQALTPLRLLPWPAFWTAWVVMTGGVLVWLVGFPIAALFLFPAAISPMFTELWYGNIVMPMAVVLVLGMRYPALWSFMLLTKVTPGIGLLWFAVRHEWRNLGIALGVTALIVVVSMLIVPNAWVEWAATLRENATAPVAVRAHVPPLPVRLVIAAVLISISAWRNWPAVLPLAVIIALPVFWYASLSLLLVWFWQLRHRPDGSRPVRAPAGLS